MSGAREPLQRIVVAGAGQVGVLAAIGLKRAVPTAEVMVLGLPLDPGALADRAATALPFTNRLHDRLGISEDKIVARAHGSHRLATRYFGWGGPGQSGALAYGADDSARMTRFAAEWGGGPRNAAGSDRPGSIAEALANAGRFVADPATMHTPVAEVDYALRWSPAAYHALLVEHAQARGVRHVQAGVTGAQPDGTGGIAALAIDGAGLLPADLFIDCTGPAARLLSALGEFVLDDWSGALPLRRMIMARPQDGMIALEDRVTLLPEGWVQELAGRDGLQVCVGVAPGVPEAAALRALRADPAAAFALAPSRARAPWVGNVIALGDAAARFEPLGHLNLDLAHRQLDLLLEMLPGRTTEPVERAEFNRRAGLMMDAVRDTLAVHYAAPAAPRVFGTIAPAPELAAALDQHARRGRWPFREETPFAGAEMIALLGALGFARGAGPQQRAARDPAAAAATLARFEQQAAAAVAATPLYADWLRRAVS